MTVAAKASTPSRNLPLQMFAGLVLGLCMGLIFPNVGSKLQPFGLAFIQLIQMVVIPLVFSAVTLGVYRMGTDIAKLGKMAIVAFGWFFIATFISAVIALVIVAIFHPGVGANLQKTGQVPQNLALSVDWVKYFLDLIPSNVLSVMAAQKVLPTLVFAVVFGAALAKVGDIGKPVVGVLEAVVAAMFRITQWIIILSPFAIFCIMSWLFATQASETVLAMLKLIGLTYLGLAGCVVMFWVVALMMGERPFSLTKKIMAPAILGFTTRSSEVTLPLHMEKLEEMGIPGRIVRVILPLGYSFNLDGSTMYIALAVCFLAEAYGIALTWSAFATILLTTLIASKGIANVPSGSLVALATVLTAMGLPLEAIAIIAGVDAFMDMGRAAINVFGNTIAVKLVHKFVGQSAEEGETVDSPVTA